MHADDNSIHDLDGGAARRYVRGWLLSRKHVQEVQTSRKEGTEMIIASMESLIGSLWFGIMLGVIGVVGGYIYCRRQGGK